MNKKSTSAMTLIELLFALMIFSIIVLGVGTIDSFARYQTVASDRRSKIQNEVSRALEHINKQLVQVAGNERLTGISSFLELPAISGYGGTRGIRLSFKVDTNNDRVADTWRTYQFTNRAYNGAAAYAISYCANCLSNNYYCTRCAAWEVIAERIQGFTPQYYLDQNGSYLDTNYITVQVNARWNPSKAASLDNPEIKMTTDIAMPSVTYR